MRRRARINQVVLDHLRVPIEQAQILDLASRGVLPYCENRRCSSPNTPLHENVKDSEGLTSVTIRLCSA